MDSSRRTSSQRDTPAGSSRDASTRSRSYDVVRHANTGYDRAYNTYDAADQRVSPSGYDRVYTTLESVQLNAVYSEGQTNDAADQEGYNSGYNRSYSTYDASRRQMSQLGYSAALTQDGSYYSSEQSSRGDKSIETFENTFNTKIRENKSNAGTFFVQSKIKGKEGIYENIYDINNGQITGRTNYKRDIEGWYLSDVVYNQLQLATQKAGKSISDFDLKSWYGSNIRNQETKRTAESLLPQGEIRRTFYAGSDEFTTLAQTPTAKSKFYLLKDYSEAFPEKRVTSITVIRNSDRQIDMEYEFGS